MRRGLCIILTVFGWLILSAANQPAENAQSNASANQASEAKPAFPPDLPYAAYPNLNADACYKAKDHDTADLCAQWRAAIAAEKTAREAQRATTWAIVAAFIGTATLIGLIVTIWQTFGALGEARRGNLIAQRANARATRQAIANADDTRKAVAAAERTANATAASVNAARDSARKQLQAYVSAQAKIVQASPEIFPDVEIIFTNTGATPARDVWVNIAFVAFDFDKPQLPPDPVAKDGYILGDIEPQRPREYEEIIDILDPKTFKTIVSGHKILAVLVAVEYTTAFDEKVAQVFEFGTSKEDLLKGKLSRFR